MRRIKRWPVMPACCVTCPFRAGSGDAELASRVLERTLFKASQICHHPALDGNKETHLCRGARDVQLTMLHRLGILAEPTDAAFEQKSRELLGE